MALKPPIKWPKLTFAYHRLIHNKCQLLEWLLRCEATRLGCWVGDGRSASAKDQRCERGASTAFAVARVKQSRVLRHTYIHNYICACICVSMCVCVTATPSTRVGIVQIQRICGICAHLLALMPGLSAECFKHRRRCSLHAEAGGAEIKLQLKNSRNVQLYTNKPTYMDGWLAVWEGALTAAGVCRSPSNRWKKPK